MNEADCHDCGLDYREFGADLILPDGLWAQITPTLDAGAGLLCANCIMRRLSEMDGVIAAKLRVLRAEDYPEAGNE